MEDNLYILDLNPEKLVRYLADEHLSETIESVIHVTSPARFGLEHSSKNPFVEFCKRNASNYEIVVKIAECAIDEYKFRNGVSHYLKHEVELLSLEFPDLDEGELEAFPCVVSTDNYRIENGKINTIESYRNEYAEMYENDLLSWTDRPIPKFINERANEKR